MVALLMDSLPVVALLVVARWTMAQLMIALPMIALLVVALPMIALLVVARWTIARLMMALPTVAQLMIPLAFLPPTPPCLIRVVAAHQRWQDG